MKKHKGNHNRSSGFISDKTHVDCVAKLLL